MYHIIDLEWRYHQTWNDDIIRFSDSWLAWAFVAQVFCLGFRTGSQGSSLVDQIFVSMKIHSIWFNFQLSTADTFQFPSHAGGRRQPTFASNSNVSTRNLYCTILDRRKPSLSRFHLKRLKSRTNTQTPSLYHRKALTWCAPTTNCTGYRRRRGTRSRQQANSSRRGHWRRSAHLLSERGWLQGSCSLSLYQRGASPLHEEENAELLRKVSRLRDIAHHYKDEAEEWFGKYMKYKRHEETRFTLLLQRHFPLSKFAGYDLAQDKLIYLWDFQRRERTIEAEKEKKRQQAQRACARVERRTHFVYLLNWLALEAKICSNMKKKRHALMHKYAKPNMHKYAFSKYA